MGHRRRTGIRQYLERTGIMLVVDEAHRLFQRTERISSLCELLNWAGTMWDLKRIAPRYTTRNGGRAC